MFFEKPPALSAEGVKEIRDIEKLSNKKLMYGFNHRHHASVIKIKEIVDSKNLEKFFGCEVDMEKK